MKDIAKALAIAAAVFCLVAVLSVSSCHAGDAAQRYEIGFNFGGLSTTQKVAICLLVGGAFYFMSGGTVAGLATFAKTLWYSLSGKAAEALEKLPLDDMALVRDAAGKISRTKSLQDRGKVIGVNILLEFEQGDPVTMVYTNKPVAPVTK